MTSSKGFQHHFNIISKFVCCGCYMKKNAAFALISFAVLKWHECLSFQLPFELTVEIPVQLHLELEVNLLVRNVIEREIEREKVQMKPPSDPIRSRKLLSHQKTGTRKAWELFWYCYKRYLQYSNIVIHGWSWIDGRALGPCGRSDGTGTDQISRPGECHHNISCHQTIISFHQW